MATSAVQVHNFSKSFGGREVIHDLSFEVSPGEIFAFLGANGSGKTTTLRALLGIYQPDSGELLLNGSRYTPQSSNILGYLPEERGLYTESKVLELMIYFGQIKGMDYMSASKAATAYLRRVGLEDKAKSKIKLLSSGQQQKVQLGITVINRPQLLILDEPTKGLDPVNRILLLEVLGELNNSGSTILFSTHQMDEVEKIAHRLVMIKDGSRRLYGSLEEVKAEFGANRLQVAFSGRLPAGDKVFQVIEKSTGYAELAPLADKTPAQVLKYLVEKGLNINRFEVATPSLNEIFVKISK